MTEPVRSLSPITYSSWRSMRSRVNSRARGYESVQICERWNSFKNFLEDMGHRPSLSMTLDRIDPNGGYNPSNCRWATWSQQAVNKKSIQRVTVDGRSLTISEWSKINSIPKATIHSRISQGWSKELAVSTPVSASKLKKIHRSTVSEILNDLSKSGDQPTPAWTRDQCISMLAIVASERGLDWKDLAASVGISSAYMSEIVKARKKSIPQSVLSMLGLRQQVMYVREPAAGGDGT